MSKQTAVEWLKDWMGENQYFIGNDLLEAIEQAKAMEKEQMEEAYEYGSNASLGVSKTKLIQSLKQGGNNE